MSRAREPRATVDFETRSECDLLDCGSWRYSLDPSTEVMCFAFRLPYWEEDRTALWHPAYEHLGIEEADCPELEELFEWIAKGQAIEAHNAFFERGIWTNVCVPRLGWPVVGHRQWRCSAAKGAALSLPRALDNLCKVLKTRHQKDELGHKLMLKVSKPRRKLKADKKRITLQALEMGYNEEQTQELIDSTVLWRESIADFNVLWSYCRTDVLAEEECSNLMRDLNPLESEMYLMDQAINERGFQIDQEAVAAAMKLIDGVYSELNAELVRITDGRVQKATQRQKLKAWFEEVSGIPLVDTTGPTVDMYLKRTDLEPRAYRSLELMRALGRSSTAKYQAMLDWVDPGTWRVHGGVIYHGASTGRWTGKGIQPHNFPRGSIKNMELAWQVIKSLDIPMIEALYDDLMDVLSQALRGAIIAGPGKVLYVADYAAIEARVVMWLADEQAALDVFARGDCIYMAMATEIYKRLINDKELHATERQMGKQAILGLGFQMGWKKFVATCAKYGIFIEDEFAQEVVKIYRTKYRRVAKMWDDQNKAAIEAVKSGRAIQCGKIHWKVIDRFLYCKLPSGRMLAYCDPVIVKKPMPWDHNDMRDALTFMSVDSYTKKWTRQDSYGGMLVENITQAVARDLMAEAMLRCERRDDYKVILSVHDELIAEADEGVGSVKEFELIMAETPDWAAGCPVKAEGWTGRRYRK